MTARAIPRGLIAAAAALLLSTLGCDKPQPLGFMVHFSVRADEKLPVAGVQISARGRPLGVTDAAGELKARVQGMEGERMGIAITCPQGYAPGKSEPVVILRSIQGLGGEERRPISHSLACNPSKRDAVVLVHVAGDVAQLPVKIDGQVVGKTDGLGFAHFHLRSDPGTRFEVQLDTSSDEKLMPQNPKQSFEVAKNDDLVVFEKSFKLPPKPKPKRRTYKKKPKVHIPERLN